MEKIATELVTFTKQLNRFKPASAAKVSRGHQRMSEELEQRLTLHSVRIDSMGEFVQEARKLLPKHSKYTKSVSGD